jgi:hypothetical protein
MPRVGLQKHEWEPVTVCVDSLIKPRMDSFKNRSTSLWYYAGYKMSDRQSPAEHIPKPAGPVNAPKISPARLNRDDLESREAK